MLYPTELRGQPMGDSEARRQRQFQIGVAAVLSSCKRVRCAGGGFANSKTARLS